MGLAVSILLIVVGALIVGYWALYVLRGHLPHGVRTVESGGYIAFHIGVEIITAILCLLGGIRLALDGDRPIALLGAGMLLYASINGLAWAEVRKRPVMSILFIPPAIVAIISAAYLVLL